MKHHFADFLDRTGDYWTIVPNRERYAYAADIDINDKEAVKILTISKSHDYWKQVFECPYLEELTLHNPSREQVQVIRKLTQLKRLRVTYFRASDIEFIGDLFDLEELILEYVSGFSDLTPLSKLTKLRSFKCENLRRVSNFDGLKGLKSLRFLHIDGTLDWNQPIENFDFLGGLENLEVIALGFIVYKTEFPAFLPMLKLKQLKKFMTGMASLSTKDFAFLEVALPNTFLCNFSHTKLDKYVIMDRSIVYFLGRGTRRICLEKRNAKNKIELFDKKYEEYKIESEAAIKSYCG